MIEGAGSPRPAGAVPRRLGIRDGGDALPAGSFSLRPSGSREASRPVRPGSPRRDPTARRVPSTKGSSRRSRRHGVGSGSKLRTSSRTTVSARPFATPPCGGGCPPDRPGDIRPADRVAGRRSYFDDMMAAGVRIHLYRPTNLHSKVLVVDDDVGVIGSPNVDMRSFFLNFEARCSSTAARRSRIWRTRFLRTSRGSEPGRPRPVRAEVALPAADRGHLPDLLPPVLTPRNPYQGGAGAARAEEGREEGGALLREDAGSDGGAVVEARIGSDAIEGGNGAPLRVRRAVDDLRHPRDNRGAGAHRARLERHDEAAAGQPVVAHLAGRSAQGEDLGVGGGVVRGDGPVVRPGEDLPFRRDHDRTHGDLAGGGSFSASRSAARIHTTPEVPGARDARHFGEGYSPGRPATFVPLPGRANREPPEGIAFPIGKSAVEGPGAHRLLALPGGRDRHSRIFCLAALRARRKGAQAGEELAHDTAIFRPGVLQR